MGGAKLKEMMHKKISSISRCCVFLSISRTIINKTHNAERFCMLNDEVQVLELEMQLTTYFVKISKGISWTRVRFDDSS